MSTRHTRRQALGALGLWMAGSPLLRAQDVAPKLIGERPGRIAPLGELLNSFEMEEMAKRSLAARVFSEIEGSGDRTPFDHIVLRPRMLNDVHEMDLTLDLFGTKMYAPILVGPASGQQRFHPDGELGTVQGAGAAQAAVVISSRSSIPIDKIVPEAKSPLWYQVYAEADMGPVVAGVKKAVSLGCRAVCLTIGTPYEPWAGGPPKLESLSSPKMNWAIVDQLRQASSAPLILKGVMTPEEARTAVQKGVSGVVVSGQASRFVPGLASPIEALPAVVDAVGKQVPVLVDGGFRRGTDILSALALGAKAVLVARPALWGLAAYGSSGVQSVLEMLQSETARDMGLCGKRTLSDIDRTMVKMSQH
jgi:4-hydroxymandelate oxidase